MRSRPALVWVHWSGLTPDDKLAWARAFGFTLGHPSGRSFAYSEWAPPRVRRPPREPRRDDPRWYGRSGRRR